MNKIIINILIISFILPTFIFAQNFSLPEASLTLDSSFYFFKSWKESIGLFFIFGAENKAKQYLRLAEIRLAEYQKMIEKGKIEIAEKTLQKYEKQLNSALTKLNEAKKKGNDVKDLETQITQSTTNHLEVLKQNLEKAPETAKKGIERAIEALKKGRIIETKQKEDKEIKADGQLQKRIVVNEEAHIPKEIQFLNENGNIKKSIKLLELDFQKGYSTVEVSKNQSCVAINNLKGVNTEKGWAIKNTETIVLNDDGEELWSLKNKFFNDAFPSPNCKYIVGQAYDEQALGSLQVVNKNGLESKWITRDDQGWGIDFSQDGKFVAISVVKFDREIGKMGLYLVVLDENGDELWRKDKLAVGRISSGDVVVSDDNIVSLTIPIWNEDTKSINYKTYRFDLMNGNLVEYR